MVDCPEENNFNKYTSFSRLVELLDEEAVIEGHGHVQPLAKEWQTALPEE